jgi:ATP-dependent DNA helicase RecG
LIEVPILFSCMHAFAKWREEGEGVLTERPEEEIRSLLKAGESQNLEYKQHVDDENKKNDFIETVVAFLNTNRGIILLGVQDDGSAVGSQKNAEDIQKLIHDSCDPPPKDIKIEEKKISRNRVILVDVPEGDEKPYQSKRDKNFYIRHNASDMRMERSELISLSEERTKNLRQPSY